VLQGFKQILTVSTQNEILPLLLPNLVKQPQSVFHAQALGALSASFGIGFHRFLSSVISVLLDGMASDDRVHAEKIGEAAEKVVMNIMQDSVHTLIDTISGRMSEQARFKLAGAQLLQSFVSKTDRNFESHVPMILQALLPLWAEADELILQTAWNGVDQMMSRLTEETQANNISFVRTLLNDVATDRRTGQRLQTLPGLCLKKGLQPLLPMFQYGLMHGTNASIRAESAAGIGDLVSLSTTASLSPFVIKMTGPLIRIIGDRFPESVKAAILNTLKLLLAKGGPMLKPFVPQLQTTFIKALNDPSATVRSRAAAALSDLLVESKRVTPVLNDITTSIRSPETPVPVQASLIHALVMILRNEQVGPKIENEQISKLQALANELLDNGNDTIRQASGHLLAVIASLATDDNTFRSIVTNDVLTRAEDSWRVAAGSLRALYYIMSICPQRVDSNNLRQAVIDYVVKQLSQENLSVLLDGLLTAGILLRHAGENNYQNDAVEIATTLAPLLNDEVGQIRETAAQAVQHFGETVQEPNVVVLDLLIPNLLNRSSDLNILAKKASQNALYFLLQYHNGIERGDKVTSAFANKLSKKNPTASQALEQYVKRTISRLTVKPLTAAAEEDTAVVTSTAENEEDDEEPEPLVTGDD
jgi:hypothetical protein